MTWDALINIEVNIDEVLELEDKQLEFQAIYLVCSTILLNHMALSVPDNQKSIDIDGHWLFYIEVSVHKLPSSKRMSWVKHWTIPATVFVVPNVFPLNPGHRKTYKKTQR